MSERVRIIHNEKINGTQVEYRADILDSEYGGAVEEKKAANVFFEWEYDIINERSPFDQPVQKSTFRCDYLVQEASDATILTDIIDADENRFQIKFYINSTLQWSGNVLTDLLEYPEGQRKYTAQIRAKDLSVLEANDFPRASEATRTRISEIIAECLQATGLNLPIRSFTNLTHSNGNVNSAEDFLYSLYHQKKAFQNENTQFTYMEVLEHICRAYNLIIRQANNTWIIEQLPAVAKGNDTQFDYDSDGLNPTPSTPSRSIAVDQSSNFILNTSRNKITGALKKITSTYQHRVKQEDLEIPDTTLESEFDAPPTYDSDFQVSPGDTFSFSLNAAVTVPGNASFIAVDALARVVLVGPSYHLNDDTELFQLTSTDITISCGGSSSVLTGSIDIEATVPNVFTGITHIQVEFVWPETTESVSQVEYTNISATLVGANRDWGASNQQVYKRLGSYSISEEIPPTVLGDDPKGVGSPSWSTTVASDLEPGGFQLRGVSETVSLQEITLRERIHMRRKPLRGLRADLWMTYSPANLLTYDSATWFFLGGYFQAKRSRWNASLISFDYLAEAGDEFSDFTPDDGTGVGPIGPPGTFRWNAIGQINKSYNEEQRTDINVRCNLPIVAGTEYWILNEREVVPNDPMSGVYSFIPEKYDGAGNVVQPGDAGYDTANTQYGPGKDVDVLIEEQLINAPSGSLIFRSDGQSIFDQYITERIVIEAGVEALVEDGDTAASANAQLTLESTVSTQGDDIDANSSAILSAESRITNQEGDTRAIIYSGSAPTQRDSGDALQTGDMWIDTGNNNRAKLWSGTAWVDGNQLMDANASSILSLDSRVTTNEGDISANASAILTAQANIGNLQTDANHVFRQNSAPSQRPSGDALQEGDYWVDTDDNNRTHIWDGSNWVEVNGLMDVNASAIVSTQSDVTVLNTDTRTVIRQNSAPTQRPSGESLVAGDLWVDLDNQKRVSEWTGSGWDNTDQLIETNQGDIIAANAQVVLKAEVSGGEITKIASVQLDASVGGGSAITLQADKISFDTKLMSVSGSVLIGRDLNAEKLNEEQILIGLAGASSTPFVHVRANNNNYVEMVARESGSGNFFEVVANGNTVFKVDSSGASVLGGSDDVILDTLSISGRLTMENSGDLFFETVSGNAILENSIWNADSFPIQQGGLLMNGAIKITGLWLQDLSNTKPNLNGKVYYKDFSNLASGDRVLVVDHGN